MNLENWLQVLTLVSKPSCQGLGLGLQTLLQSEMTYYVSRWTLNSTRSILAHCDLTEQFLASES